MDHWCNEDSRRPLLLLLPRCQIICGCHRNHFNSLRYVCSCIRIGLATKLKTERARIFWIFQQQYEEHKIPWWYSISQKLRSGPPQTYLHICLSLCCELHGWYIIVASGNWLTWVWWYRTNPSRDWNVMDGRMGTMTFLLVMTASLWWQESPDYRRRELNSEQGSEQSSNTRHLCPI